MTASDIASRYPHLADYEVRRLLLELGRMTEERRKDPRHVTEAMVCRKPERRACP